MVRRIKAFVNQKFGADSRVARLADRIPEVIHLPLKKEGANPLDSLTQIKNLRSAEEKINLGLTLGLIIIMVIAWQNAPAKIKQIHQLKNDITEQAQVIEMEKKNNAYLAKLQQDRGRLEENLKRVYSAVPEQDEKAEEVIAMLESIAQTAGVRLDSIGIREVPESQFMYDDLVGVVQPFEYTFAVESNLQNILSLIDGLRRSFRLMDVMTLEIQEGKGAYKAAFTLMAYNLDKN
jgi:hypothetical protein